MQPGSAGVVSPVFVGRARELDAARSLIDRAVDGTSGLMLLAGEAGVGKTRLVEEATAYAGQRAMQVLVGHCVQLGTEGVPFAPLVEALRELVRAIGPDHLDDVLGPARELVARLIPNARNDASEAPPLSSSQVLELVLGLIERLSAVRPLLLVLEDLHWADRSTLELAAFLAQNLRGVPAALLFTYRSDEVDRRHPLRVLQASWDRSRAATRLELPRFDRDEVRAQLAAILGTSPDAGTVELVYRRSEGNAFLAEEMLSVVRSGDPRGLPPSLKDILLARLDQLSPSAQQVLQLAAVAGRSVPERLLVAVSGLDEVSLLTAIREAVDAHLLVVDESDHGYRFRHTLARDAVYDDLLPGERVRLHTAYAEALARDPGLITDTSLSVAAQLAHHSYAALDLPRALEASITAGREASAALAPLEALAQYDRALLIWPRLTSAQLPPDIDHAQLLWLTGEAAYHGGEIDRAVSLLLQALDTLPPDAPPERRANLILGAARAQRDLGRVRAAVQLLEHALELLPAEPDTAIRAEVLASLSNGMLRESSMVPGEDYAERAVKAARAVGATRIEADAQITLGYTRAYLGRADEGVAAMWTGLRLALDQGDTFTALRGYVNVSDLLESLGRSAESVEAADAGLALAQQAGLTRTLGSYLSGNLAESLMHLGEWQRAWDLLDAVLDRRPEGVFEASAQVIRAELAMLSGDIEQSRQALSRVNALLIDADVQFAHPVATIDAELHRAAREFDESVAAALAALEPAAENSAPRYLWPLVWTGIRAETDRIAARLGPAKVDGRLTAIVATLDAKTPPELAYRALCSAELAEPGAQTAAWTSAVDAWREVCWPWPLAYSQLRLAEAQAAGGERAAAAQAVSECWGLASRLDARPLMREAEQLAVRARIELASVPAAEPSPEVEAAPDDPLARYGLTVREREVLLLVAAGRSNPEIAQALFISPKTASVHVSNILTKLGLSSRVQAAGMIHRIGLEI